MAQAVVPVGTVNAALGEVAGTITTQPQSSSPVRDEKRTCFAATVTVGKGDDDTTASIHCV